MATAPLRLEQTCKQLRVDRNMAQCELQSAQVACLDHKLRVLLDSPDVYSIVLEHFERSRLACSRLRNKAY